ncbi:hypothetical protein ES702_03118 [subsurface metagenome]
MEDIESAVKDRVRANSDEINIPSSYVIVYSCV